MYFVNVINYLSLSDYVPWWMLTDDNNLFWYVPYLNNYEILCTHIRKKEIMPKESKPGTFLGWFIYFNNECMYVWVHVWWLYVWSCIYLCVWHVCIYNFLFCFYFCKGSNQCDLSMPYAYMHTLTINITMFVYSWNYITLPMRLILMHTSPHKVLNLNFVSFFEIFSDVNLTLETRQLITINLYEA